MKNLIYIFAALLTASTAMAGNRAQNKLIKSDVRPTPAQIMSKQEHFEGIKLEDLGSLNHQYSEDIPTVIVALEKAFPGGTYAFLGRDMDLVADAVEAFYLSIGQKDRVQRIRFSTPSLQGATPRLITNFLIQSGLNADPNVHKPPMVLVDFTSFNPLSQSTTIITSALKTLEKHGIPAYDVMTRLNVATIAPPNIPSFNIMDLSIESLDEKLEIQNAEWAAKHKISSIFKISVGTIGYGSEWHDRYGPIQRGADGKLTTTPANFYPKQTKEAVYKKMAGAIMITTTDSFKNKVTELAIKNSVQIAGLNTPAVARALPKTLEEKAQAAADAKIQAEQEELDKLDMDKELIKTLTKFDATISPLPPDFSHGWRVWHTYFLLGYERITLSSNGYRLTKHLLEPISATAPHYHEIALNVAVKAYQDNKISDFDLQHIFMITLRTKPITDLKFVKTVQANYQTVKPIEVAIGQSEFRDKYMLLKGITGDNYRLLTNQGALPLSCKFLLLN